MDEKSALLIIAVILGYILSFLLGYFVCKSRGKGLDNFTDSIQSAEDSNRRAQSELDEAADRAEELGRISGDIQSIFDKYSESTEEKPGS